AAQPSVEAESALGIVERLLDAARAERDDENWAPAGKSLAGALADLGPNAPVVESDLTGLFPLPELSLRYLLRNLISNAASAGARRVRAPTAPSNDSRRFWVAGAGAGLGSTDGYAWGSGVGLGLVRRLVGRHGGSLELIQRPSGGARVLIAIPA